MIRVLIGDCWLATSARLTLAAILLATVGCDYVADHRLLARVVNAHHATVSDSRTATASRELSTNTMFETGATIRTAADGDATICLLPGVFLHLDVNSAVRLDALKLIKYGNDLNYAVASKQARVELLEGTVTVTTPQIVSHVDIEIVTPAATVSTPAFATVCVTKNREETMATVSRGIVSVNSSAGGEAAIVRGGEFVKAASGMSQPPVVRSATESSIALRRLAEGDRLEAVTSRWSASQRGAAPPA